MPVSGRSSKQEPPASFGSAPSDSAEQTWVVNHARISTWLMSKTHRGCAGTRGEGRWGHVSTHTGRGQSHTRCLMKEKWQLWQLWAARKSQRVRNRKQKKKEGHVKSKAISDKETFAAEAATSSNGIQRLSSLVLQLPNNAINPAFLLLSSVMACTDSPVVVMETVVLSAAAAAAVGVVENAAVVVSANKHTARGSEASLQKLLPDTWLQ